MLITFFQQKIGQRREVRAQLKLEALQTGHFAICLEPNIFQIIGVMRAAASDRYESRGKRRSVSVAEKRSWCKMRASSCSPETLRRLQKVFDAAWFELERQKSNHTFPWAAEATRFLLAQLVLKHARDYRQLEAITADVLACITDSQGAAVIGKAASPGRGSNRGEPG